MKIFYKKDFQKAKQELEEAKGIIKKYAASINNLNIINKHNTEKIKLFEIEKQEFQTEILKLKAEIEDLHSDRYLIRKVNPGRPPKGQTVKIARPMSNNVRRFMKQEHD